MQLTAPQQLTPRVVTALADGAAALDAASERLIASAPEGAELRFDAMRWAAGPIAQARDGFALLRDAAVAGSDGVPAAAAGPAGVAVDLLAAASAVVAADVAAARGRGRETGAVRTELLVDDQMGGLLDRAIIEGLAPLLTALAPRAGG